MRKINLEKITAVVALSYLVLIPVTGYYLWQKVKIIDNDVIALCDAAGLKVTDVTPIDRTRNSVERFLGNKN